MVNWGPSFQVQARGVDSIGKAYVRMAEEAASRGDQAQAEIFIDRAYETFGLEYEDVDRTYARE